MMTPVARLILVRSVDRRELINAMVWVTLPALIGPLIGPALGGFITTYISWHWIFLINIPIGLAGIVLATLFIEDVRAESPDPFDPVGAVLAGLGIGELAFGGSLLGLNFLPTPAVIALILLGAAAADAYVLHARRSPAPVLVLSLLAIPTMRAAVVGGFIYRSGIGAMPFLLPLLLQLGFGLTPFQSGLITLSNVVGAMGMKTVHSDHSPAFRIPPRPGGECAGQRRAGRGVRDLHAGRFVRVDYRHFDRRRLFPLA